MSRKISRYLILFGTCYMILSTHRISYGRSINADETIEAGESSLLFDTEKTLDKYWMHYMENRYILSLINGKNYFSAANMFTRDELLTYSQEERLYLKSAEIGKWLHISEAKDHLNDKSFYEISWDEIENYSDYAYQGLYLSYMEPSIDPVAEIYYIPATVNYTVYYQDELGNDIKSPAIKAARNTFMVQEMAPNIDGYEQINLVEKKTIYHEKDKVRHGADGNDFFFVYKKMATEITYQIHHVDETFQPLEDEKGDRIIEEKTGFQGDVVCLAGSEKDIVGYTFSYIHGSTEFILEADNRDFYVVYEGEEIEITIFLVDEAKNPLVDKQNGNNKMIQKRKVGAHLQWKKDAMPQIAGYAFIATDPSYLKVSKTGKNSVFAVYEKEETLSTIPYYIYHVDKNGTLLTQKGEPLIEVYEGVIGTEISISLQHQKEIENYEVYELAPSNGKLVLEADRIKNILYITYKFVTSTEKNSGDGAGGSQKTTNNQMKNDLQDMKFLEKLHPFKLNTFQNTYQKNFPQKSTLQKITKEIRLFRQRISFVDAFSIFKTYLDN